MNIKDLSGADLRDAYLYGANLSNANLYGANLRNANLSNANRYEVVAEFDGIQMRHIYPIGGLEIQLALSDAAKAEKWRSGSFRDWIEAAGLGDEYAYVSSWDVVNAEGSAMCLLYQYEALASEYGQGVEYTSDYRFTHSGNPLQSLFEGGLAVFEEITW